jgi:glycosyltransferase involved in cell wall biosynthesis
MRVGIEAQRIFRHNPHGMDRFAIELIQVLCQEEAITSIVVFVNATDIRAGVLPNHSKLNVVVRKGTYVFWEQWILPRLVQKYTLDILHFTSNTASRFISIPSIITVHDIIYLNKHPLLAKGYSSYQLFGNWYRRFIVNFLLSSNRVIVTVSRAESKRIEAYSGRDQVPYVYNGVGHGFFNIEDSKVDAFLSKRGISKPYILFLGNTDPKKNTPRIIKSFVDVAKSKKDLNFVIADFDRSTFCAILGKDAPELLHKTTFLGFVDQSALAYLYNGASVFVYCSLAESFGIPIVESFACGTPVLTSNIPSLKEVSDGGAMLMDPTNQDEISSAIIALLEDSEMRKECIRKGHLIANKYSWAKAGSEYLKIYKTVC